MPGHTPREYTPEARGAPASDRNVACAKTRHGGGSRIKILIVDDDDSARAAVETGLRSIGEFELRSAQDGKIGLDLMRDDRPDLVILDILMPRADGFDVLREVRRWPEAQRPGMIAVVSTAAEPNGLGPAVQALGADSIYSKPIRTEQLRELVNAVATPTRIPTLLGNSAAA